MKHFIYSMYVLLLLSATPTSSFAHSRYTTEPSGLTPIVDNPFNNTADMGPCHEYFSPIVTTDSGVRMYTPSGVIKSQRYKNSSSDSDNRPTKYECVTPDRPTELFVAYTIKPSNPFIGWTQGLGNKIGIHMGPAPIALWIVQTYASSGGARVWGFYHPQNQGVNNTHMAGIQVCDNPASSGSCTFKTQALVDYNQYQDVSIYLRCSTTRSSRDGIVQLSVNNQIVGNWQSVNFDDRGGGGCYFDQFQTGHSWDARDPGYAALSSYDFWLYDHMYASKGFRKGGGTGVDIVGGATTPIDNPLGPPAAPTGVTAIVQ